MAFDFLGLGPSCLQIQDIPAPSSVNDREQMAQTCFVAFVTARNLQEDTLYLPKGFTSSVGLNRECRKIVVNHGERRSWTFDLMFNIYTDIFHMSPGWKAFCEENGKRAGDSFTFTLVENGETLLLSFGPTEPVNDGAQGDSNMKDKPMELERENKYQFMTLKVVPDSLNRNRQYLKAMVMKKNGIKGPTKIILVGKDGSKCWASLRAPHRGRMCLGKGWKPFAIANGLKTGDFFTFELVWEDKTPMLSLFKGARKRVVERGESSSSTKKKKKNRLVSLKLTYEDVKECKLVLPYQFTSANGIKESGKIIFVGRNNLEWPAYKLSKGLVAVGYGWQNFCEFNGVKIGDSFLLEATDAQDTLKFCAQVL
ncbi:unnamed protein product [Microthlaspi erraticum]|uniref:TF-B3 domain-containing protein n=1 Tax=Microthlaspi erraticum TaxID=1685480 RepID=A0A6D2IWR6_9BRAS|nr:unnamed protein product [Microthlaspi erraticum]